MCESIPHEDGTQDGNEHRLSGHQNIESRGTRESLQSQGLSDRDLENTITIDTGVEIQDDEKAEEVQNDR